jgi:hypothetical protein
MRVIPGRYEILTGNSSADSALLRTIANIK